MNNKVHLFSDLEGLSAAAAEHVVTLAEHSIDSRRQFHVALTGGSTPRRMYECLASTDFVDKVDWHNVHIYFGDERCVPPDHSDSNFGMANEALLRHVPIPPTQIHRMQGEMDDAREAANAYATLLASHLPVSADGKVQFDLVLLGLGPDGHIASLFPDTPILHEQTQLAAAVYVDTLQTWRISVTLPVINNSRQIMMLVSGEAKADILRRIFDKDPNLPLLPVQVMEPIGTMEWYLDEAAAQRLSRQYIS